MMVLKECSRVGVLLLAMGCGWLSVRNCQAVTLAIGQNFAGSTAGTDSSASPADGNGAAGIQHFVEFINGRFSVYDKSSGQRVQTKTDTQFWKAANVTFATGVGTTDPRILFDAYSQRWFASMVSFTSGSSRQRSNRFLLAVSDGSDPTGSWQGFSFPADSSALNFADFPTLGVDQTAVYLGGDMFDRSSAPVGSSLVVLPKSGLLSTPATIAQRTYLGPLSYGTRGDILQPAVTIGAASTPECVLAVSGLGIDFKPQTNLVLSHVLPPAGTNQATLSSPPTVLDVPSYSVPINPPQPDGTDTLDDGDARLAACLRRVGDVLYATHAVQVDGRAAVRWYKINATNDTLIQAGTISDPSLDLFYPSIAANEAGVVVIGCNGSSLQTYVSSYAVAGEVVNGSLAFGELTLLKAGTASYQNTGSSRTSRWGDYSATTVDPVDPTRFWTIQMIAVSSSQWATQITELLTGLRLSVRFDGSNLTLSWPDASSSDRVQFSQTLSPAAWTDVPDPVALTNNTATVVLPVGSGAGLYRVVQTGAAP